MPQSSDSSRYQEVCTIQKARIVMMSHIVELRRFAQWFIYLHSATTGVFRNAFREIIALTTSGNRVRHMHLKMTPLPGYWDADRDRPRTRNNRNSNPLCTNICISKSPTFRLRTLFLLLASVILAPNRK